MQDLKKSLLITFEGIDGSGKSTVARRVQEVLQAAGYAVVLTKEPGGTDFGREVRAMVQSPGRKLNPISEFLLFAADRAHHITTVIKPLLEGAQHPGTIILCDRMADSSVAYQAFGRGLDRAMVDALNVWTLQGVKPDATCYMIIDYAVAQQRINARSGERSGYDQLQSDFFERVVTGYESLYKDRPDVWRIDATQTVEACAQQVYDHIMALVQHRHDVTDL